ncbi:IS3 family transposase [Paenibacillus baimaensis]|uniref:IS3 family transposase n=1 Tax=Paenibacillus baimaensis TaxID=2982185 RepID=UPI0038CD648D
MYLEKFRTRLQAYRELFEYIEYFYNHKRNHSSIVYSTPDKCEHMYCKSEYLPSVLVDRF